MNRDPLSDTPEDTPLAPSESKSTGPATADVRVDIAARTHTGKVRKNNEDNFHVVRFGRYLRTLLSSLPDGQLPSESKESGYAFAVADGMGGKAAGEVASRMAITLLVEHALQTPDWILGFVEPHTSKLLDRTTQRFQYVNQAVIEQAERDSKLKGMGTTLSLALSLGSDLIIAHVGDSPMFLYHQRNLHRLTRDHTLGERMAYFGITDAGRFHHILTRAVGMEVTGGEPDIRRHRLADGDRLLLCTDGLTEMINEETIARELGREASADEVCQSLIDLALESGGKDNVTVVIAGYCIPESPTSRGM